MILENHFETAFLAHGKQRPVGRAGRNLKFYKFYKFYKNLAGIRMERERKSSDHLSIRYRKFTEIQTKILECFRRFSYNKHSYCLKIHFLKEISLSTTYNTLW